MLSLFVVYVYAVQGEPSVAGLAVTSVCSFICCWRLGIMDLLFITFARTSTRPPIEWVRAFLPPGVNRPGLEVDHLPLFISDVKNKWSYASSPSCIASLCWQGPIYISPSARTSKKLKGWCDVLAMSCCGLQYSHASLNDGDTFREMRR
jgi:hypothetical protein